MRLVFLRVTHGRGNQKTSINMWLKHQIFYNYWQTFSIFLTLSEDISGYCNPSKTHTDISKIYYQKIVAFVQKCIFKIFFVNLEKCSLVCSFLWYLFSTFFGQTANICMFKNLRRCRKFYGIVEAITEEITKNISDFF